MLCVKAECVLLCSRIALNLGRLCSRRRRNWVQHACWPLISRVLPTGLARNCFQEWLGLECWQEISIWAQPSVKWNYWQSETRDCAKPAEQLVCMEATSLSLQGVPHSVRGREPLSVCLRTRTTYLLSSGSAAVPLRCGWRSPAGDLPCALEKRLSWQETGLTEDKWLLSKERF